MLALSLLLRQDRTLVDERKNLGFQQGPAHNAVHLSHCLLSADVGGFPAAYPASWCLSPPSPGRCGASFSDRCSIGGDLQLLYLPSSYRAVDPVQAQTATVCQCTTTVLRLHYRQHCPGVRLQKLLACFFCAPTLRMYAQQVQHSKQPLQNGSNMPGLAKVDRPYLSSGQEPCHDGFQLW